jgi:hypothetical protein
VEKNGFLVTVTKVTLDRADQRGGYYSADRINRTQGLKLSIKNTSFSAMPEGEVQWQILNRKHDSTRVELTSGKEKLKALRPAETADLSIGAAEVTGYRDISETSMDKLEWQVTILQAGKEVLKTASTASFDVVAKRATKVTAPAR